MLYPVNMLFLTIHVKHTPMPPAPPLSTDSCAQMLALQMK
jgi:hypothetical protein